MPMTVEAIRELLNEAVDCLLAPTAQTLRRAERLTDEANAALRELIDPPDPYKDMNLRPGLKIGEAAAMGMIAPPDKARA
jgi:hypothetical protein